MTVKKILLLVHASQKKPGHLNWLTFRDLLREHVSSDVQVEMASLSELLFVLDGDSTRVTSPTQTFDLADFDLIVFRTVGKRLEEAIAAAAYCRKKGIPYIDTYLPQIGNAKLSCAFVRWEHDLPVPKTIYGPLEAMIGEVSTVGIPAVLKADAGKKGRDNYLVKSTDEIREHVSAEDAPTFVLQNFIPNKGDLRLVVMNGKVRLILKRTASGDSHLNNTSQGGSVELVPIEDLPKSAIDLALKATELEKLAVAGVDLIQNQETAEYFILEVNRAPQIATGGFAEQKTIVYAKALEEILNGEDA